MFFPPTFVHGTDTVELWVANDGNGVLNVTDITSSNTVFGVDRTQFEVPPFDSVQVNVVFVPDTIGIESGMLTISSNDTLNPMLDVSVEGEGIAAPFITVSPDTVTAQLPVGDSVDVVIQIENNGGSPLSWSANLGAAIANTGKIPTAAHADADPRGPLGSNGSARGIFGIGDLLAEFDLDTITGRTSHLGVEYFDGHFWVTSSEAGIPPNFLHKITESGQLVQSYSQPTTTWGWRDLAHDGMYLYGSVSPVVEQIDAATGQPTGVTIPGPTIPNRALAYDPATDHFWTMNFQSGLLQVQRLASHRTSFTRLLNRVNWYSRIHSRLPLGGGETWLMTACIFTVVSVRSSSKLMLRQASQPG